MSPKDCVAAVRKFNLEDVLPHGEDEFEFVPTGGTGISGLPIARTPRKYTYQSCTMVIANLGEFRNGQIPGFRPIKPWPTTDFGTYRDVVRQFAFLGLIEIKLILTGSLIIVVCSGKYR